MASENGLAIIHSSMADVLPNGHASSHLLSELPTSEQPITSVKVLEKAQEPAPAASLPTEPNLKFVKFGMIGVGGCGGNHVKECMSLVPKSRHDNESMLLVDTDGSKLKKLLSVESSEEWENHFGDSEETQALAQANFSTWKNSKSFNFIQLGGDGDGAGADPAEGERLVRLKEREIKAWINEQDVILIVAGAGKGTGGGATPVIQEWAQDAGKNPITIIVMPDKDDTRGVVKKANTTLDKLLQVGVTLPIYNSKAPDVVRRLMYPQMIAAINAASTLPILSGIREISQEVGIKNSDTKDLRATLRKGNLLIVLMAEMQQPQKPFLGSSFSKDSKVSSDAPDPLFTEFLEAFMNGCPYENIDKLPETQAINLWLHGNWNGEEEGKIKNAFNNKIPEDSSPELEIISGIFPVNDGKKWALALCVADPGEYIRKKRAKIPSSDGEKKGNVTDGDGLNSKQQSMVSELDALPLSERPATILIALSVMGKSEEVRVSQKLADRFTTLKSGKGLEANAAKYMASNLREEITRETGIKEFYHPALPQVSNA